MADGQVRDNVPVQREEQQEHRPGQHAEFEFVPERDGAKEPDAVHDGHVEQEEGPEADEREREDVRHHRRLQVRQVSFGSLHRGAQVIRHATGVQRLLPRDEKRPFFLPVAFSPWTSARVEQPHEDRQAE